MTHETCECGHPKSHHWTAHPSDKRKSVQGGPWKCLSPSDLDCRCGRYVPAPEVSDAR